MTDPNFDSGSISKEKTMWELYRLTGKFPYSKFNRVTTLVIALVLTFYCILQWSKMSAIETVLRKVIESGFVFGTCTIGFLVAGFTVFVTVTKVDVFIEMAEVEYEGTGESYLKYNLVQFMLVFCHYIAYLFMCVCYYLFAQPDGLIDVVLGLLSDVVSCAVSIKNIRGVLVSSSLIFIGAWTIYIVLLSLLQKS